MPYISNDDRSTLDDLLDDLLEELSVLSDDKLAGSLNYCFSKLSFLLFEDDHSRANLINGVFTSAQQEFSRRKIGTYEDAKFIENGDIEWPPNGIKPMSYYFQDKQV